MKNYRFLIIIALTIMIFAISCSPSYSFEQRELRSVFNTSEQEGKLFLLFGSVKKVEVVHFWMVNENGALVKRTVRIKLCEFYDDQQEGSGYVVIKKLDGGTYQQYTFHVPKNSIYDEFNLE